MPATRSTAALAPNATGAAFDHLLQTIWGVTNASVVYKTLDYHGYKTDVAALVEITDEDTKQMSHPDPADTTKLLPTHSVMLAGKLRRWRHYLTCHASQGDPLNPDQFINLACADFQDWVNTIYLPQILPNIGLPPLTSTGTTPTPIDTFNRGVKRDPSAFPVLQQDSQYDTWHRATVATAKAQNCGNIVDVNYTPIGPSEIDLFELQKTYMYSVFVNTLKTDTGKQLVRNSADAHKIFKDLTSHYTLSAKASIDGSVLLEYVTGIQLGAGASGRGSTHAFVLHL